MGNIRDNVFSESPMFGEYFGKLIAWYIWYIRQSTYVYVKRD